MYADRALRTFDLLATRDDRPQGAKMWMGLQPKDVAKRPKFLNCWAPKDSQISDQAYGFLIVTEGENFTRFHSDFEETLDSLITLYGAGEKIWVFTKPSYAGRKLEDEVIDCTELMQRLIVHKESVLCCVQHVGDTVYLPYGWLHCVITIKNISGCSSLLSIGLRVPRQRFEKMWKLICDRIPLDKKRAVKYAEGPLFSDLEKRKK